MEAAWKGMAGNLSYILFPIFRDMFSVPPQKLGMEVVLHFLFSQLNSHLCYEEFRDCWPVYDHKQDQLFRKKSANWITGIAKVTKKLVD